MEEEITIKTKKLLELKAVAELACEYIDEARADHKKRFGTNTSRNQRMANLISDDYYRAREAVLYVENIYPENESTFK